jgi:hypothetical protein
MQHDPRESQSPSFIIRDTQEKRRVHIVPGCLSLCAAAPIRSCCSPACCSSFFHFIIFTKKKEEEEEEMMMIWVYRF